VYRTTGRPTVCLNSSKLCASRKLNMHRCMAESLTGVGLIERWCRLEYSNVFCTKTVDTSNISLNKRMMFLKSIFHNVSKSGSIWRLSESSFSFNTFKMSCCLSPGCATCYKTVDEILKYRCLASTEFRPRYPGTGLLFSVCRRRWHLAEHGDDVRRNSVSRVHGGCMCRERGWTTTTDVVRKKSASIYWTETSVTRTTGWSPEQRQFQWCPQVTP